MYWDVRHHFYKVYGLTKLKNFQIQFCHILLYFATFCNGAGIAPLKNELKCKKYKKELTNKPFLQNSLQ